MIKNNLTIKNYLQKKHLNLGVNKKLYSSYKNAISQIINKTAFPNQFFYLFNKKFRLNFKVNDLKKFKKYKTIVLVGMGGSILGSEAIYSLFRAKIKKNFYFLNDLNIDKIKSLKKKISVNKTLFLIISKSGNTTETVSNFFYLDILKKNSKNIIIITEKTDSILFNISKKFNLFFIEHKNYIGGRYSVLSEVGMLPAELMGLNYKKFRQLNNLVKNKFFMNALVSNVEAIIYFLKLKKFNSVIINYDEQSTNLFNWYQQLVAESLGKKNNGILPIISVMPKDNHSVMQLYLDGFKNNFFTFFYSHEKNSAKINNEKVLFGHEFLKNKDINQIMFAQKEATEVVFKKKNIPFRSFEIKKRDEKTLGELFCFFILETLLVAKALKINPYDQPAVELIKKETKKILL